MVLLTTLFGELAVPSHHKGKKTEQVALDAYVSLTRSVATVNDRLNKHLDDSGITESQFAVLEILFHLGPLNQTEICKKVLKTGGNMTLVIDNLEKSRLVERQRDPNDRRARQVHLTDAGRKLITTIFPAHAARVAEIFSVLTGAEQRELKRLCKMVGLGLRDLAKES